MSSKAQEPSRKRAAPGAWPQHPPANLQANNMTSYGNTQDVSQTANDQLLTWGGDPSFHLNSGTRNVPQYAAQNASSNFSANPGATSQLVRRLNNAQMGDLQQHHAAVHSQLQRLDNNGQSPNLADESDGDEGDLDARAQEAKRESQSRRPPRQIPPFIQKLSR